MRVEDYRASSAEELPSAPTGKRESRRTDPFLRGPIPMEWLSAASALCKSALLVGLALWFLRGVIGKQCPVKFTSAARRSMRLTREQSRRGIPALEAAGLLRVVKGGRGRCPVVEILTAPRLRNTFDAVSTAQTPRESKARLRGPARENKKRESGDS